jgi:hypothetical protein
VVGDLGHQQRADESVVASVERVEVTVEVGRSVTVEALTWPAAVSSSMNELMYPARRVRKLVCTCRAGLKWTGVFTVDQRAVQGHTDVSV